MRLQKSSGGKIKQWKIEKSRWNILSKNPISLWNQRWKLQQQPPLKSAQWTIFLGSRRPRWDFHRIREDQAVHLLWQMHNFLPQCCHHLLLTRPITQHPASPFHHALSLHQFSKNTIFQHHMGGNTAMSIHCRSVQMQQRTKPLLILQCYGAHHHLSTLLQSSQFNQ